MNDNLDILVKKLKIAKPLIVREQYEMMILKVLFESAVGINFVFKGGTALRLAYGSKRYSEDLDFSVINKINIMKTNEVLASITKLYNNIELKEIRQKKYTFFALFKIIDLQLQMPFSIKFEASTRPVKLKKNIDYSLTLLKSEVSNLTVLAQVTTLEFIEKEKLSIHPKRIRDIYDLWYISQKLEKNYMIDFSEFDKKEVKRELHKLLPEKDRRLLEKWL